MNRKITKTYNVLAKIIRTPFALFIKKNWYGAQNLPTDGGFIAVANHVSEIDSMTFMHYMFNNGVPMKIMAKAELFKVPLLGWALKATGQIPVYRYDPTKKNDAMVDARKALAEGECIGIFPEGTLTRDLDYWPMKAKTGAARLALETGVPVIPIAQWGAHEIMDRYRHRLYLLPRKTVTVVAGEPVDLSDLYGKQDDFQAVEEATDRIMLAITAVLAKIRNETPPAQMYDRKVDGDFSKKELADISRERHRIKVKSRRRLFRK